MTSHQSADNQSPDPTMLRELYAREEYYRRIIHDHTIAVVLGALDGWDREHPDADDNQEDHDPQEPRGKPTGRVRLRLALITHTHT